MPGVAHGRAAGRRDDLGVEVGLQEEADRAPVATVAGGAVERAFEATADERLDEQFAGRYRLRLGTCDDASPGAFPA
ncbi:MAG: hypothetical protein OXU81_12320 [Gammaproteobacteria bacterium]|nr:hypothetical protein [Gammaproteobacteria bacterium]